MVMTRVAEETRRATKWVSPSAIRQSGSVLAPFLALALLAVVFGIMSPVFLTGPNFLNILSQSSVLLVLALASTFIILMGSIDLSVGAVVTLSASLTATLARDSGELAFLLAPIIGSACGLINGLLVAYGRLPSFLVTLGTSFTFVGVAKFITDGRPVPVVIGDLASWFTGSFLGLPKVALWALLLLVVSTLLASRTSFGRYLYAIGGAELTARLSGVPVDRVKVYAFVLTGALSGMAGMLQVFRVNSSTPDLGEAFLLLAIAAVVMGGTPLSGGVGGPLRTVLGVLVITTLSNGMVLTAVHPFLQIVVLGIAAIVAVAITLDRKKLSLVK